jgi:hypothetical protein
VDGHLDREQMHYQTSVARTNGTVEVRVVPIPITILAVGWTTCSREHIIRLLMYGQRALLKCEFVPIQILGCGWTTGSCEQMSALSNFCRTDNLQ